MSYPPIYHDYWHWLKANREANITLARDKGWTCTETAGWWFCVDPDNAYCGLSDDEADAWNDIFLDPELMPDLAKIIGAEGYPSVDK